MIAARPLRILVLAGAALLVARGAAARPGDPVRQAEPNLLAPPAGAEPREPAHADESAAAPQTPEPAPAEPEPAPRAAPSPVGEVQRIRYTLEGIEVRGNARTRDRVVLRYVPFRAGDSLDVGDREIELTRYRLLGTGFFSAVQISLRKGHERGFVVLVVEVVERNTFVVNDVWMGLSADADANGNARPLGAYGGVDVAETNLAGTGIALGGALGVAPDQLALRTRFTDPAFLGTSWMASASLLYNDARDFFGNRDVLYDDPYATQHVQDYAVVRYKRFGGSIGTGHDLSVTTQLWLDWRLERIHADLPLAASHVRGLDREPLIFDIRRGDSTLSDARATLSYDSRDQPILPTRGWYASLTGDVSLATLGSDYGYTKLQARASRWWPLPHGHVVRIETFGGAVSGNAPFFEKFYVGDYTDLLPDRVLDLNSDRRPAPNFLGTDIVEVRYGDFAAKVQGEYRVPIYRGHRAVYGIDLFGSAGVYGVATARDISDPARGYSGFSRIPVDLTFNVGFRMDTSAGGFVFAFSNIIGFLPVHGSTGP